MGYKRNGSYHGGNRQKQRDLAQHYIKYVVPHCLAAFALVLHENTDMTPDDIAYMIEQTQAIWNRSTNEGWDIRERCSEELDIDVMHELEAKERGISG